MRTIIDIPEVDIKALDYLSKQRNTSRAETIRQALSMYLADCAKTEATFTEVFGIWKTKQLDSIKYQEAIRSEW